MSIDKIIVAGFGGQGVLRLGQIIAQVGLNEGKEVTWLPSYGSEMRGGTANCAVNVSVEPVASPIIRTPNYLIVMNSPSLLKFQPALIPGGKLIINSSLIMEKATRNDVDCYYIPALNIAYEESNPRGSNMVLLGAYLQLSGSISAEGVFKYMKESFAGSKAKFAESNKILVQRGMEYIKANYSEV